MHVDEVASDDTGQDLRWFEHFIFTFWVIEYLFFKAIIVIIILSWF